MRDIEVKNGTRQDTNETRRPSRWRDYFDWMVCYARRRFGDNDARIVANEALYVAYRLDLEKPDVENEMECRRWLSTLICNQARALRRRERAAASWELLGLNVNVDAICEPVSSDPDGLLEYLDVARVLGDLNEKERSLVLAYCFGAASVRALANELGIPVKTLRSRIRKLAKKLIAAYKRREKRAHAWGIWAFVWESLDARRSTLDRFHNLRAGNMGGTMATKWFALGASCLALVAFAAFLCAPERATNVLLPDPALIGPSNAPALFAAPIRFVPSMMDVLSLPAKRLPQESRKPVVRATVSPVRAGVVQVEPVPTIATSQAGLVLAPQAFPSTASCIAAYSNALTALNHFDSPHTCLAYLSRPSASGAACPENPARIALRADCEIRLSSSKQRETNLENLGAPRGAVGSE